MHITKLQLENFRGAADLSLDLHENLNVFYGINGAGKTTILDAVAIGLSWLTNRIRTEKAHGKQISEFDIQNGKKQCSVKISGTHSQIPFYAHPVQLRKGHPPGQPRFALRTLIDKIQNELSGNKRATIPLMSYYPVNRAVLDIPLRIRAKHEFSIIDAHDESLTSAANFRTFFEWFRNREDIENEKYKALRGIRVQKLRKIDWSQYQDSQIQAVRDAIYAFMPDFSDLTVRRSPLRMEVTKKDKQVRVEQLSDGEKCLMAMVGDIARRLSIANPSSDTPLHGDGVVLIDEIDLHLHPTWQHLVIPQLTKTFPNCQFLISTHSPHVITHVAPENLFSLELHNGELMAEQPRESYGKSAEQILRNNMGLPNTRPDIVTTDLDTIYQLIDSGKLESAKRKIEELRNGVPNKKRGIGNDPELVRSAALIKRKELIGK